MASDIVERLRHCSENCGDDYLHELAGRAAAEIERLRLQEAANKLNAAQVATLRAEIERLTNLHHSGVAYMAEADKALTTLRDEVLEEAAKVADVYGPLSAAAIRALKEKT